MTAIQKKHIATRNRHTTSTTTTLSSRIPTIFIALSVFLALLVSALFLTTTHNNDNNKDSISNSNTMQSSTVVKAVSPMVKQSYKLLHKTRLSSDSFLLRYGLPEGRSILGLDPALPTCIKVEFVDELLEPTKSKPVHKSYSPVTHPNQKDHFDLVVKSYPYQEGGGGGVGAYLCDMAVGDSIRASLKKERSMHGGSAVLGRGWKQVGLVAGGTGIAPLLQIARILLEGNDDDSDNKDSKREQQCPRIHLLFVNHTPEDILGREAIEALAAEHPDHFFVTYSFTRNAENKDKDKNDGAQIHGAAQFLQGRGDVAMAQAALPPPSSTTHDDKDGDTASAATTPQSDTMVFVCGRDGFVAHWAGPVVRAPPKSDGSKGPKIQGPLLGVLAEAGYTADQVFKY